MSQQTFQSCFNVVFRLIWSREVAQRQINVEATFFTSTSEFKALNNVVYFNVDLNNTETTLSFSTSIFTTLGNVKTTLWIWPFEKKKQKKPQGKHKVIILSFKEKSFKLNTKDSKCSSLYSPLEQEYVQKIFAKPAKILKISWIYWITKTSFKPSHIN